MSFCALSMNVDLGASNLGKQLCVMWDVLKSHRGCAHIPLGHAVSHWDMLYPTGTCVCPTGMQAHPSGTCMCHNGTCLHPTGTCMCPTGMCSHPTGTYLHPTGMCSHPTGTCLHPTGMCSHPTGTCLHPIGMCSHPTGMCICPNGISLGATGGVYLFNRTHFCQMTTCICFSPLFRCCFEIVVHLSRIVLYIIGFFTLNVCHRYLPFRVHPQIIKINYMSSGLHVTALWDLSCPTGTLGHERLSQDPTGKWVLRPNFS